MLQFDDLNEGDEIRLNYRFRDEPVYAVFLGFSREVKLWIGKREIVYRMELQLATGAIVKPRTSDIVPGSVYLVGSYRALE